MSIVTTSIINIMGKITSSFKTLGFIYDFAADGGALGSIGMGVYVPANAQIVGYSIMPVADLTSGGAAQLAIGLPSNSDGIAGSAVISTYNSGTVGGGIQASNYYGGHPTPAEQVIVTISVATITAGSFKCILYLNEFN